MNRAPALDAAPPGTLPEGTVVYATGDIHGRSDLLARLHGMIRDDASRRPARRRIIVYLGDYISRGPDSRGVVDMIIGHPLPGFERIALRGNHEDLVLRFLGGELGAGGHWLDYGGIQALASYGIDWRGDQTAASLGRLREVFADAFPPAHHDLFRSLAVFHREGGYLFAHAGLKPGVALADQNPRDMMWIRGSFLGSEADFGPIVVHGHCVSAEPDVRPNRVGIDTGAYRSGHLTCLVCEDDRRSFLQT